MHNFLWQINVQKYEGRAKSSVTNRLPWFYPRYILILLHCSWMVCWIVNDTPLFRANYFPTDRVISNWNRCSHIHWPIYLLHLNMDQAKDGPESTLYMTTPLLISVRLLSHFLASEKVKVLNHLPYSPDLSPCDFFLFPRLKKRLSGNKYTSRSSLGGAIYQCLQQMPKEDYLSAFRDWVKRL